MNLLQRTGLLKKLFRSFEKYSLTTYSAVQKSFSPRKEDQLQTRFLNFIEHFNEINENGTSTLIHRKELNFQTSDSNIKVQNDCVPETMEKTSSEYDALITSIETLLQPKLYSNTKISLSTIDDNCCKILSKLSQAKILQLLHSLTRARPNAIALLKFYKHSLVSLRKSLASRRLSTQEILQLLYFEGLRKKLARRNVKYIITFLPPMSDLSLMEQCIVAHVAFKCGVPLKDIKLLQDIIETNAEVFVKDTAILVTFCKALRHAGPSSDCWLENLSKAIVDNTERFTMKCAAHTLSLYAEAKLERSDVLQRFFDDSMKSLVDERVKRERLAEPVEKDVDRILWASSILNYKLRSSDMKEISLFINRRYAKLSKKPFLFVNMLLSLWILNCRLKEFVHKCLAEKVFLPIVEEKELWKPVARLQLFLSCVRIEAPEIQLPDEIVIPYKVGMKIHGSTKRLRRMIDKSAEQLEIEEIIINCPVDGIYIPGVSFKLKSEKSFHIDLLDETTCFKGTTVPHGLMNLKLRLLSKIGHHSILITEAQLNDAEAVSLSIERYIKNIIE